MVINETVYFYEGASAEAIAALADVPSLFLVKILRSAQDDSVVTAFLSRMNPVCIISAVSKHAKTRCPSNTAAYYPVPTV